MTTNIVPVSVVPPPTTATASPRTDDTALAAPITIWTDGGCRPNPGLGAWAAAMVAPNGREQEISGTVADTTNNRMEMTAAIMALESLSRPSSVILHTDSELLFLGITSRLVGWQAKGWRTAKGKPVENRDLWERLVAAAARHAVEWRWTRGHAGDPMNERVDRLATAERERGAHRHV